MWIDRAVEVIARSKLDQPACPAPVRFTPTTPVMIIASEISLTGVALSPKNT